MRAYRKPTLEVELFEVNQNVAVNCLNTTTSKQVTAVTVDCIKDGSETIFTAGTTGCVRITAVSSSQIVEYNGTKYYYWPFSSSSEAQGAGPHNATMEAVAALAGNRNPSAGGYHVGVLDDGDIKVINAS